MRPHPDRHQMFKLRGCETSWWATRSVSKFYWNLLNCFLQVPPELWLRWWRVRQEKRRGKTKTPWHLGKILCIFGCLDKPIQTFGHTHTHFWISRKIWTFCGVILKDNKPKRTSGYSDKPTDTTGQTIGTSGYPDEFTSISGQIWSISRFPKTQRRLRTNPTSEFW